MKSNIASRLWDDGIIYNNTADRYVERLEEISKTYRLHLQNRVEIEKHIVSIVYNFVQVLLLHIEILEDDLIAERFIRSYVNNELYSKVRLKLDILRDIVNQGFQGHIIHADMEISSLYSSILKIFYVSKTITNNDIITPYINSFSLSIISVISNLNTNFNNRGAASIKILEKVNKYLTEEGKDFCAKLVQSHINRIKSCLILFKLMKNLQVLNNRDLKIESAAPVSINYYKNLEKVVFKIYDKPAKDKRDYFSECAESLLDIFQLNPALYLKNEQATEIIKACINPSIYFEFVKRLYDVLDLRREIYENFKNFVSEGNKYIYIYARAIVSFIYNRDDYLCINEEGKVLRPAKAVLELNDLLDKHHNGKLLDVVQNFFSQNNQLKEYRELIVKIEGEKKPQASSENSQISLYSKHLPSYVQQLAQERRGFEQYSARM
ncbi:hypothetical protein NF27_BK00810 [Candidatus Jidaibacter acanthamoeba]|uniref:Uncharacterized protein n=1 Tax=Candidatus Jidaibacter acanthamoebae TaxID=86105 RepID=A0A0C1R1J8_9RICK|nr:hypothetical protein [Candidatus Jidaibacter acanthamoeba]KIE06160.1 hypothetical protein NF27_BK00810 [Candidatus Jidaibacter acanthamoeba]